MVAVLPGCADRRGDWPWSDSRPSRSLTSRLSRTTLWLYRHSMYSLAPITPENPRLLRPFACSPRAYEELVHVRQFG